MEVLLSSSYAACIGLLASVLRATRPPCTALHCIALHYQGTAPRRAPCESRAQGEAHERCTSREDGPHMSMLLGNTNPLVVTWMQQLG